MLAIAVSSVSPIYTSDDRILSGQTTRKRRQSSHFASLCWDPVEVYRAQDRIFLVHELSPTWPLRAGSRRSNNFVCTSTDLEPHNLEHLDQKRLSLWTTASETLDLDL